MKALVFAPNAVADIDGIYDHTEEFWGFEQAEDYTFSLRQACRILAAGEQRGRHVRGIKTGYLALTYRSHFIIYRETKTQIVIIRILHQRMNLSRHL